MNTKPGWKVNQVFAARPGLFNQIGHPRAGTLSTPYLKEGIAFGTLSASKAALLVTEVAPAGGACETILATRLLLCALSVASLAFVVSTDGARHAAVPGEPCRGVRVSICLSPARPAGDPIRSFGDGSLYMIEAEPFALSIATWQI